MNTHYAVFGATGSTGMSLVRELVGRGRKVRAGVREPARLARALSSVGLDRDSVDIVRWDLEDPRTFDEALASVDRCYVAVGGATGTPGLVEAEQGFIDAARSHRVEHYVRVSGIDARLHSPATIQQWHGRIGEHLIASGVPYTILEPSFFMQNFLGLAPAIRSGVLPVPTGDGRAGLIDARDIALAAAAVLTDERHQGRRYVLTGPELFSHAEVASLMSRILEKPVRFEDLPMQAFEQSLVRAGLPAFFAFLLADVYDKVFRPGLAGRVTDDLEKLTGRPARTLGAFLREHRDAFA